MADVLDDLRDAVVTAQGETRGMLDAAFNKVAHPANWKLPIDAVLVTRQSEMARIGRAVEFFTASKVMWTYLGGDTWRCRAPGYYAAVGA